MLELCDTFANEYATHGIGVTDAAITDLARLEPDGEKDPFV
jgi:hypothetical protein